MSRSSCSIYDNDEEEGEEEEEVNDVDSLKKCSMMSLANVVGMTYYFRCCCNCVCGVCLVDVIVFCL